MKTIFSPLIAGLSGKAADAVASRWKGRPYFRKRVIPFNPKSPAQLVQRGHLARMAPWFRSIGTDMEALMQDVADLDTLSDYNMMVKRALKDLADGVDPRLVRGNPAINGLLSITCAVGTGSEDVNVSWEAGAAVATHYVSVGTCPIDPDEDGKEEPDVWTWDAKAPVAVSVGSLVDIPVGNAEKDYYMNCVVIDLATMALATMISGALAGHATSSA